MLINGDALKERRQKERASLLSLSPHWLFLSEYGFSFHGGPIPSKTPNTDRTPVAQPPNLGVPKTKKHPWDLPDADKQIR